jgi:hypothetical protein
MYEFLDRLISVALPRVRDFRGVSPKGFDGRGNFTHGLRDQLLFPEIDYMKVDKARGMNVSVVTSGTDRRGSAQAAAADGHALQSELKDRDGNDRESGQRGQDAEVQDSATATAASCAAGPRRSCASSICAACASQAGTRRAMSPVVTKSSW